jgi:indolepyruvate ferredoxin oxidoreductase beta subunit
MRASPGQLIDVVEYMKPRVAEIAGTMPATWGQRLQRSAWATRLLARFTGGRRVRSTTITGFLMLRAVARLRRWRRGTLRYQIENSRIEQWLSRIEQVSAGNHALGVEVARAQRLIKGYGDTHEHGWRSFASLMEQLEGLQSRADGAAVLARLQAAALADEQGSALALELVGLGAAAARVAPPAAAIEHA